MRAAPSPAGCSGFPSTRRMIGTTARMLSVDLATLWRAALVQTVAVAVLSVALALALPHSFFESWGWVAGPGAWALCAALTARLVRLPVVRALIGAAVAGLPSVVAVLVGAHWLGAVFGVAIFAAWCARLAYIQALRRSAFESKTERRSGQERRTTIPVRPV